MKKSIEYFVKFCIYFTFFVPLVVIPSSFIFPFIVPKVLLLRSLVMSQLGGYILLLIINWREYKPRLTALNLVLSTFIFSFALSTFAGADPYHSFWDNHERMLGLFTILHYFAFYIICGAVLKNWKDWRLAMKIFLIAGSLVMLLCVPQKFDHNFLLNQGSDRAASTLGNSIYVGGYGLFLFFVALLLLVREKDKVWQWVEAVLGLLAVLGLFLSGTRGSMLGFIAGIGVMVVGYMCVLPRGHKARPFLAGIVALGILSLVLMYGFRQTHFVQRLPVFGRLMNITFSGGTSATRFIAWRIAIDGWKEKPLFGWGPNNFFYAFNKYYNPRSLEFGYGETWFDNAHNIILNTLTVQGVFGLIVYLSIFGMGISSLLIAWRKYQANPHVVVMGSAFLIAHLTQNVTVFENPTSYLYFMFWLAMVSRLSMAGESKAVEQQAPDRKIGFGWIFTAGLFVVILIAIFNLQPARANMKTLTAMNELGVNPTLAVAAMKEALFFQSPHIDDIRGDLSRSVLDIVRNYSSALGKERSLELVGVIFPELEKNLTLHPLDIRNHITLAQLSQLKAVLNNSMRYILDAENYIDAARQLSPRRQQLLYTASMMKIQLGKNEEAARLVEQAISDDPRVAESYWRLAYIYHLTGQKDKAKAVLALVKERGLALDAQGQEVEALVMSTATPAVGEKK